MSTLIDEFALTPDVFDSECYLNAALYDVHLQNLKRTLLEEALIRDLRNGDWHRFIDENRSRWDDRGKELFKKLKVQGRLRPTPAEGSGSPVDDRAWCEEALRSHATESLSGIMTSHKLKLDYKLEQFVESIEKLSSAHWWTGRGNSVSVLRTTNSYLRELRPVLRHAKSLMFIDHYLDPTSRNYREFPVLLEAALEEEHRPLIELHRVVYEGSGPNRQVLKICEWEERFEEKLGKLARDHQTKIDVFIWSDFHDRYLISNLVGLFLGNGFDTDNKECRWLRLDRKGRDEQQRKFDPSVNLEDLKGRFVIE